MPIVVPLSSWAERRKELADWLVDEMSRLYGVDCHMARAWVTDRRVVPMLDGLDSVSPDHRSACVAAINHYRNAHGAIYPLVVTCRTSAYEALPTTLRPRVAVEVQRLTVDQVRAYTAAIGPAQGAVRATIDQNPVLAELITTPAFLSAVSHIYQGSIGDGPANGGGTARGGSQSVPELMARRLLNKAAPRLGLDRHVPRFNDDQMLHYLGRLADTMTRSGQDAHDPTRLRVDMLSNRMHRWLITSGGALAIGLTSLLLVGAVTGFAMRTMGHPGISASRPALAVGILTGTIAAAACVRKWLGRAVEVDAAALRPRSPVGAALVNSGIWGLSYALLALPLGVWFDLASNYDESILFSFVVLGVLGSALHGAVGISAAGLIAGVVLGAVTAAGATAGIRAADGGVGPNRRPVLRVAAQSGLAIAIAAYGLTVALLLLGLVTLRVSCGALRQPVLRLLLIREGLIPRDHRIFLQYAHAAALLDEAGGRYSFSHPLLRQHFAERPTP